MSAEIIATLVMGGVGLGVGVGLAALILTTNRGVRQDMAQMAQMMAQMETRLVGKIDSLALQLGKLCGRMAYIDGLVSGLAPAIVAAARENQARPSGT